MQGIWNGDAGTSIDLSMDLPRAGDITKKEARYSWLKKYQFKPGQSGNPGGVSKTPAIPFKWALDLPYPPKQKKQLEVMTGLKFRNDLTCGQAIAIGQVLKAVGSTDTAGAILDRVEGAVRQAMELSGGPLLAPVLITQYVEITKDGTPVKIIEVEPNGSNGDGSPGAAATHSDSDTGNL